MTEREKQHLAMDLKIAVQRIAAIAADSGRTVSITVTANGTVDASTWVQRDFDKTHKASNYKTVTSVEYEDLLC